MRKELSFDDSKQASMFFDCVVVTEHNGTLDFIHRVLDRAPPKLGYHFVSTRCQNGVVTSRRFPQTVKVHLFPQSGGTRPLRHFELALRRSHTAIYRRSKHFLDVDMTMTIVPDLAIEFEGQSAGENWRPSRSWRGFAVEHVQIEGTEPYSFHRSGDTHYLAWHDLLLEDGDIEVDGLPKNETHDLRNTITFVPSGCGVKGWSAPANRRNSYTALYFDPGVLHEELELRYQSASLQPALYAKDGPLQETMRKLCFAVDRPDVPDLYAESACIMAAVEALSLTGTTQARSLTPRQIKAVLDYVRTHYADDISLQDLASVAGLSRYHFGRAFKAATGQSPYAYILAERVERASELLASCDTSVELVALRTGFQSPARLRRSFQQLKGVSPQAFRRQLR